MSTTRQSQVDYSSITKADSLITEYMTGLAEIETPYSYDFWCGVWLVSNAIGRTVVVPRPQAPVYLNMYLLLCAEAGITRKSTAVRHATSVLNSYRDNHDARFDVLTGSTSPEKLCDQMARLTALWGHSHVALSSSELVTLMGKRSGSSLPGLLTDLYDCPSRYTRQTMAAGETVSSNVFISLLAASTPSWLASAVSPDVIEGGFTSRCLFVVEEKPKRLVAWPDGQRDAGFVGHMADRLSGCNREARYVAARGGIHPTRTAKATFTEWYQSRHLSSDAFGASFQSREDHHILRLAAILAASDNTWEIQDAHIRNAIKCIAGIRRSGVALFGSGVAASRMYSVVDRVRQSLVSSGRSGISQSAITALCRRSTTASELSTTLTVMHELGLVQKFLVETGDRGRPVTMWRATRSLLQPKAIEDVVDLIVPQEG